MKSTQKVPVLPPRRPDAHKGDFGKVLILAGSRGMTGAAALAGNATLRSGAGLCTLATPESVYPIVAANVTCCTFHPLPETAAGTLGNRAWPEIRKMSENFDVVALGPGLGRHPLTTRLVHRLVREIRKPMVIDADGLNAVSENVGILKNAGGPRILTPHPMEMSRLSGMTVAEIQRTRRQTAFWFAREYGVVLLLKGHETVVTDGESVFINPTGNPGMATGGSGDVLTGLIAALVAQRLSPFSAACLGAYLHGMAGDMAAEKFGQVSLIATDILDSLPEAFRKHQNKNSDQ